MTIDKSLLFGVAKDAVISVEWVANTDEKIVNFMQWNFGVQVVLFGELLNVLFCWLK